MSGLQRGAVKRELNAAREVDAIIRRYVEENPL
jgi:hypothetical protein